MPYSVTNLTNGTLSIGQYSIDPGETETVNGGVKGRLDSLKNAGKIAYATLGEPIVNGKMLIGGARDKFRDDFTSIDPAAWTFGATPPDTYGIDGNVAGAEYLKITKNCLGVGSQFVMYSKKTFTFPFRLGVGMSLSQRISGEEFYLEAVSADLTDPANPVPATDGVVDTPLSITSFTVGVYSSANVARVQLASWPADGLRVGDRIAVVGMVDTRMNIFTTITTVYPTSREILFALTFTTGTYTPGTATIQRISPVGNSRDALTFMLEGSAASTQGQAFNRGENSPFLASGSISFGTSFSDAVVGVSQPYSYALQPRFNTELHATMDKITWLSQAIDSANALTSQNKRSQNLADISQEYLVRVRARSLPNRSLPVARILTVRKAGSTTATVTTDAPHGLAVGNYVQAYGVFDQTNFANLSTAAPVASVISPTQFTVVWGASVTATSYGGAVILQNGAMNTAVQSQYVASVALGGNGYLCVGTNNSAPVVNVGDTVRLYGLVDSTNTVMSAFEGSYKVAHITPNIWVGTTTNTQPTVTGIADTSLLARGMFVSGAGIPAATQIISVQDGVGFTMSANATAGATVVISVAGMILEAIGTQARNTNLMAGCFFRETDLRLNFIRVLDHTRTPVEVIGGVSTGDQFSAAPVNVLNTLSINSPTVNQGTSATSPGWYVQPGAATVQDVASAAITTTTTTAAVTQSGTNCAQFNIPVTAFSGTTPTMDVGIEESDDSGTNWFRIYDFPRITASGMYRTPPLRLMGNRIRYVQTLGGSSPSFTRAINRNNLPFLNPDLFRQFIDRTLVVNTINSVSPTFYTGGAQNLQMVLALGAVVTSSPTIQLQGSDDNATWYNIGGTLAGGAANTTVQLTVNNVAAKFVRVIVTVAGSGATLSYLLVKAFGG